jgi:hypothetical protein
MTRRELMLLLGGAVTAPRAVRAQQKTTPVVGYLHFSSPGPFAPFVAAFRRGLSETGFVAFAPAGTIRWIAASVRPGPVSGLYPTAFI